MPPYPGFRLERFAPAIALGMETGRSSGEAAVAPRFLGSPPPRTQAGEGDDSGPALAPPPRRRLASAEFHGTTATETRMFLNAVGVFSFLPAAFDPGFVLRVFVEELVQAHLNDGPDRLLLVESQPCCP